MLLLLPRQRVGALLMLPSALREQVLESGSQVGSHHHSLNPVHRLALLEQNQRGQRCGRASGVQGLESRWVAENERVHAVTRRRAQG